MNESDDYCVSARVFDGKPDVLYVWQDFMCLNKGRRVNDDSIEFFMSKLSEKPGVMCMSPRFYTSLTSRDSRTVHISEPHQALVDEVRSRVAYDRVARWYSGVFRHDMVFIPVCTGRHWILLVICYPWAVPDMTTVRSRKRVDMDTQCSSTITRIMAFDSSSDLGWVSEELVNPVRDYLTLQWMQESGAENAVDFMCVPLVKMHTPQQKNDYDCGLYVLRMAQEIVQRPPAVDDLMLDVDCSKLPLKYMSVLRGISMTKYRMELKREMRQCSIEQGRWDKKWDKLLDVK